MNRQQILALEPGKLLDEMIAFEIMGYKKVEFCVSGKLLPCYQRSDDITDYITCDNFQPSERIQDAFKALDEFGYNYTIYHIKNTIKGAKKYRVGIDYKVMSGGGFYVSNHAETLPFAISRALLLAAMEV